MNYRFFKLFQLLFAIAWVLLAAKPAITQTGNQSDITGPDPGAIAPLAPTDSDDETSILPTSLPSEDDNIQPPSEEGEVFSEEGEFLSEEGEFLSEEGEVFSEEGEVFSEEGEFLSEEGEVLSEEGEFLSEEGEVFSEEGEVLSEEGEVLSEEGEVLSEEGEVFSEEGEVFSEEGEFLSEEGEQLSSKEGGQLSLEEVNQQEPIPVQGFNQPSPQGTLPPGQSNQANRSGEKPPRQRQPQPIHNRGEQRVDRPAFEAQLQQVDVDVAVQLIEEYQAVEFSDYLGVELYGEVPSFDEISTTLYDLWQVTGQKAAFVYVSASDNQLDLFTVVPNDSGTASVAPQLLASTRPIPGVIVAQTNVSTQHLQLPEVKGEKLRETIQEFRQQITDPRYRRSQKYLENAQQLYQWLIAPMEAQLEAEGIDILVLSMDSGLRGLPIGALHDGEQFLIEKYGVAIVPSFGLTDVSYFDVRQTPILAMGASMFQEQGDLPAVPIEMHNILRNNWHGQFFLNEQFTVEHFKTLNQQEKFGIIHLATHGEFNSGNLSDSYIQFYHRKINIIELGQIVNELGWSKIENPPIELLVLSACRTAVGSPEAELGFAGLALQAGVKSALASLWYVSDAGTLGLMSEFYQNLSENPIKSQALRQTQVSMLKGEVRIENGQLRLSNGEMLPLTPELAALENVDLSHPYFWSAFMMIGNWN